MKLSTQTRYAVRALVQLATIYPLGTTSLRDVADSQDISPKYLERIFDVLRSRGLLRTVRGPYGGYALARPPETITLREVCETLDGSLAPIHCVDCPESCPRRNICPTRDTWVELHEAIVGVLQRTTIQDLVGRQNEKNRGCGAGVSNLNESSKSSHSATRSLSDGDSCRHLAAPTVARRFANTRAVDTWLRRFLFILLAGFLGPCLCLR